MNIGTKIRGLRVEKGLTQQDVATRLSISDSTYRKIENSTTSPDLNQLEKIAKILEKSIFDFIPDENITINQKNNKGSIVYSAYVYSQQLSEKVIEQYEKRLDDKTELIKSLYNRIKHLESLLTKP